MQVTVDIENDDLALALANNPEQLFDLIGELPRLTRPGTMVIDGFTGSLHHERAVSFLEELVAKAKEIS